MTRHTIREELLGVIIFVGIIWLVFVADCLLPIHLHEWGVRPRSTGGLVGIPIMPFLHADWQHLLGNTIPLIVLLSLLAGSRANSGLIVIGIVILGGFLLWVFGRSANHIGASSLVFGLICFLIVSGLMEHRIGPFLIAIAVGFFYGGTLLGGVLPTVGAKVSWDGHLFGAIAGGILAAALARGNRVADRPPDLV